MRGARIANWQGGSGTDVHRRTLFTLSIVSKSPLDNSVGGCSSFLLGVPKFLKGLVPKRITNDFSKHLKWRQNSNMDKMLFIGTLDAVPFKKLLLQYPSFISKNVRERLP